ncbi:hypothetical protein N480_08555 [Pseudoalteromonas luteoviolacea S2607]|nr:hypothetical protein N480_08555 [Pseudoalteromonas luteoviolacea S2607]
MAFPTRSGLYQSIDGNAYFASAKTTKRPFGRLDIPISDLAM